MRSSLSNRAQSNKTIFFLTAIGAASLMVSCGVKGRPSAPLDEAKIGSGSPQIKPNTETIKKSKTEKGSP